MTKQPERGPEGEDLGEAKMLYQEAEIAYGEGDYAKAVALYKQAYFRSNSAGLLFNIAQACRKAGQHADAKYWYREYLKKVPDSPHKAVVEELIEKMKEKVPDPPKEGSTDDDQARAIFEEAEALFKKKQYAEAAEKYQAAYKIADPERRGSLAYNIAQSYRHAKNFPFAAVWYEKALSLGGPTVSEYRAAIEEHLAAVRGEMKKQPERGPEGEDLGEAKMLFQEAEIAYGEGDYAKAVALYKQAYSRSNKPDLIFNIAQACRKGGQYADAKYWYRQYLEKVPGSPHKAVVEELIEKMKEKVDDPPDLASEDDAREKFEQAERLYKIKMYSEAADLYVDVYYDPAVAFARGEMAFNLGQCMRQTGNTASAVEWYKKALEQLPEDSPDRIKAADLITELTGTKVAVP
jgi:tetratricopeptide (TPR) repeat protein